MTTEPHLVTSEFRALSAALGQNRLRVQGPGGNTSIKSDDVMWIKASGTELAHAETQDIFVPVDRKSAIAEAREEAGDGSCKTTVLDPAITLRPSIETTFHAALEFKVVLHTHSISTLTHAISPQGLEAAKTKLADLPFAIVPYAKPGLPLTKEILARANGGVRVFILQNHGLICCGNSVGEAGNLIEEVETRLSMPVRVSVYRPPTTPAPEGFAWHDAGWIAKDTHAQDLVLNGTYYPDHVVFLGPALPVATHAGNPPAILHKDQGIALKTDATASQKAMLQCISDLLMRLPHDWSATPIGDAAEAALLDWDAEKYRQALAARG
ncbi:MAG: class II aldolase/adducin family protein [Pseudomonadota bacterium]